VTHVPYKGLSAAHVDVVGGQISMAFDATPTALPQAQSGAIDDQKSTDPGTTRAPGHGMTEVEAYFHLTLPGLRPRISD
jgi:hypothetical protein